MLRRFEMYSIRSDVAPATLATMESTFLRSGRYIPELRDCALGHNLSPAPLDIIWEHAYDSPAAYQRYMIHPYHAAVLDRFLLRDAPQCILTDSELRDAGLVGYACEGAPYRLSTGARRITLLSVDPSAPPEAREALEQALGRAHETTPGMTLSVLAANSMASCWFDGVTPIRGPSRWTHIWEQGFETLADLEAYRLSDQPEARAERDGWTGWMGGIIAQSAELYYEIRPGE
jgi:hypothetical protein